MEKSPVTCRTLEDFYYIDARTFEKQYKEVLSDYRTWSELPHADKWLVFAENIGPNLAIDETSFSNGELYTIVTNCDRHGGEGCLVAVVSGTKSEDVIRALELIPEEKRETVEEVTLDLSDSMRKIVRSSFPKVQRVIDRFHIQKLAFDAVQELNKLMKQYNLNSWNSFLSFSDAKIRQEFHSSKKTADYILDLLRQSQCFATKCK